MRIGFITNLTEEDFRFAAENDFPCVEYNCANKPDVIERLAELKGLVKKYGVPFSMIGFFGPNYISEDPEEARQHKQGALRLIDFCAELGAPLMTTGGGLLEGKSISEQAKRAIPIMADLVEHGKKRGVKVAAYNCHWTNFIIGPEAWQLVHTQIPDLGIKYDPSHCIYDGRDYLVEARDWGNRFYHVHAKGSLIIGGKRFTDPPAGMDQTNWGALIAVLYHHKFAGDIVIEPHSDPWTSTHRYGGILIARRHLAQFIC